MHHDIKTKRGEFDEKLRITQKALETGDSSKMTLSTFDAKSVLASEEAVSSQLPSTEVDLGVEPDVVCLGNLLLVESNPRDEDVGSDADKLRDIARDNAQGCNSIDIFLGPVPGPEPCPCHFWSFETCI